MSTFTRATDPHDPDPTGQLLLTTLDAAPPIALVLAELPAAGGPGVRFTFTPIGVTVYYADRGTAQQRTAVARAVTSHFGAAHWGQKLTHHGIELTHPRHLSPHAQTDPLTLSAALHAVAGDNAAHLLDTAGYRTQAAALRATLPQHRHASASSPTQTAPAPVRAATTYTGFADPVETGTVYGDPGTHVTDAPVVAVEHLVAKPAVRLTVRAPGAQYLAVVLTGSTGPWDVHPRTAGPDDLPQPGRPSATGPAA
ncbi:hypothetical protein ABTY61_22850 [Kitasatospora sp. NPDC096128]|uniref:hypothetical protein n=1 Tax=Kitasatospora sp. NPDC096128 TaxID=3155547 RepID=UPI0033181563